MPGQHPQELLQEPPQEPSRERSQEEEAASGSSPQAELGRGRALAEGTPFASYVIVGLLGSGGLARVYRARHHTLGHEVALKIFEPAAAAGPSGVTRFLREAHLAASVHHPHIVQTRDGGVHEGVPYLVMELLEGRDLEAHLRAERTVEELALLELAIPIVAALMALHAQGLVHGDLGPGNIFLVQAPQGPGVPKVLDVGISKPHRQLRLTAAARQRLMGSPLYMAPEAMLGRELTPASDQYSLGLILYECVTGVNPFLATSLKESVRLIIAGQRLAVLEQSVAPSPGLADIIERALSVEPADRFPDLASLGRALLRLADQRTRAAWEFSFQSEAAVASSVASARAMPAARNASRWGAPLVALALLGWVTAGVVSFTGSRPDPEQAYVALGPRPSASPPVSLAASARPAEASAAAALAPCRDLPTDLSAEPLAAAGASNPLGSEGNDDGSSLQQPLDDTSAAVTAVESGAAAPGAVESGALEGGALELPAEPAIPAEGAAPVLDWHALPLSEPSLGSANGDGAPLPKRGTNNAPIFD